MAPERRPAGQAVVQARALRSPVDVRGHGFPGVRQAVDAGDWARAGRELAALTARIEAVAEAVDAAVESR